MQYKVTGTKVKLQSQNTLHIEKLESGFDIPDKIPQKNITMDAAEDMIDPPVCVPLHASVVQLGKRNVRTQLLNATMKHNLEYGMFQTYNKCKS
jgi:hypothetical protein